MIKVVGKYLKQILTKQKLSIFNNYPYLLSNLINNLSLAAGCVPVFHCKLINTAPVFVKNAFIHMIFDKLQPLVNIPVHV